MSVPNPTPTSVGFATPAVGSSSAVVTSAVVPVPATLETIVEPSDGMQSLTA